MDELGADVIIISSDDDSTCPPIAKKIKQESVSLEDSDLTAMMDSGNCFIALYRLIILILFLVVYFMVVFPIYGTFNEVLQPAKVF